MANKLDPMDIKQILVLLKDSFSNHKIGAKLGISRDTVNSYVQQFGSNGYSIGELLNFEESRLNELFTIKTTIDVLRHDDLMRYLERIDAARSHPGFTFQYQYNDYAANVINPYIEIRRLLTEYNKLLFKRKEASRLELFQTIERG